MNISVYRCYIYISMFTCTSLSADCASEATQHPDRRPNDPDAVVKFMRIKKAVGFSWRVFKKGTSGNPWGTCEVKMPDKCQIFMMVKCWVNDDSMNE